MFNENKPSHLKPLQLDYNRHKNKIHNKTEQTSQQSDDDNYSKSNKLTIQGQSLNDKTKNNNKISVTPKKRGRPRKVCTNSLSVTSSQDDIIHSHSSNHHHQQH